MVTQSRQALLRRFGVQSLSVDERLELAEALYESVEDDDAPPSPELQAELERRVAAYKANPRNVLTWAQVKEMLKAAV